MQDTLHHRELGGDGRPPLIILHGMLGSSRNWVAAGRDLAEHFRVHALDLPNHGESPHLAQAGYPEIAGAVRDWATRHLNAEARPLLLGHSLGGKVAMRYAASWPDRIRALVVADIAPRDYAPHYRREVEALRALDLQGLRNRQQAEEKLTPEIPDLAMRRFLLTNLVRGEDKGFAWQCNLEGIERHLERWARTPLSGNEQYGGPALFLKGERSGFVRPGDQKAIHRHFPKARIMTISAAGHNVHVENRSAFVEAVLAFIEGVE